MTSDNIIPFPSPNYERRQPENDPIRREIESARENGDPIRRWIALADAYLKAK